MKVAIEIPDYITIEQYQKLSNLEHLTTLDKTIKTISIIAGIDEHEIKTWDTSVIPQIYKDIVKPMDVNEEFHAIFNWEDQLYGYANIDKMTLGEFTDLERLSEDPVQNLHEIIAILYRPIKKHIFNNFFWKKAHKVLLNKRKVDNVFKHYTLKKYNSEDRFETANVMKQLALQYALGAMAFFLGNVNGYLTTTLPYLTEEDKQMKKEMMIGSLNLLTSIGAGLRQFIISPNQVFSISQGKKVSLT